MDLKVKLAEWLCKELIESHKSAISDLESNLVNAWQVELANQKADFDVRLLAQRKDFDDRLIQAFTAGLTASTKLAEAISASGDEKLKEYFDSQMQAVLNYSNIPATTV